MRRRGGNSRRRCPLAQDLTRSEQKGGAVENLTCSKSLEAGGACPRCGGLLVLRDVAQYDVRAIELWCVLCARVFRHGVREVYRPMPEQ